MIDTSPLRDFSRYSVSAWALVAANALPLLGVLFLGWDTFAVVVLYWVENVIIGAINVLKILTCDPDPNAVDWSKLDNSDELQRFLQHGKENESLATARWAHHGSKLFFIPFFIFHYGMFCFVHGVFIFAIFGREAGGFGPFGGLDNAVHVFSQEHLWWGVAALAASHLWSFFVNYLGHGENTRTVVPLLMVQPYARVVVLHIAILLGGFVSFALGNNTGVLMILIVGKTLLDLSLHLRERERNAPGHPLVLPEVIFEDRDSAPATPPAPGRSHPPARPSSDG